MKEFDVEFTITLKGTSRVVAEDEESAREMVDQDPMRYEPDCTVDEHDVISVTEVKEPH